MLQLSYPIPVQCETDVPTGRHYPAEVRMAGVDPHVKRKVQGGWIKDELAELFMGESIEETVVGKVPDNTVEKVLNDP